MPAINFSAGTPLPDPIYVDANVVIAFLYGTHPRNAAATVFILEALKQARRLFISTLAIDELWHQLMSMSHRDTTGNKFDPSKPAHVNLWSGMVKQKTDDLFGMSMARHCPSHPGDVVVPLALSALQECSLGARDAFHLACANAAGAPAIATMDSGFDNVLPVQPGLTILKI
jgi:predicted nucleic acid-binding protein